MHENEIAATAAPKRIPWNKGKLIGPRQPLRQKHVWGIRTMLQMERQVRELALCNRTDVRASEKDWASCALRANRANRQTIDEYLVTADKKPGEYLFNGLRRGESMTTRQYARLLADWLVGIGLDPHVYGTHLLRRTKATLIYRRTGNLRAVQLLLGHTKIESTVRYLGIEVDDALELAEQTEA